MCKLIYQNEGCKMLPPVSILIPAWHHADEPLCILRQQKGHIAADKRIIGRFINNITEFLQLPDALVISNNTSDMGLFQDLSPGYGDGIYGTTRQPLIKQAHVYTKMPYGNSLIISQCPE